MPAPKLAETEAQIQALRSHVLAQCIAIASSIDSIPPGVLLRSVWEQWRRELQQAADALILVEQHLAKAAKTEA